MCVTKPCKIGFFKSLLFDSNDYFSFRRSYERHMELLGNMGLENLLKMSFFKVGAIDNS